MGQAQIVRERCGGAWIACVVMSVAWVI